MFHPKASVLLLASVSSVYAFSQTPEEVAKGVILVSSDAATVKSVSESVIGKGMAEVLRKFARPRFDVRPVGKGVVLVVDGESGPLGIWHDRAVMGKALLARLGEDLTIDVNSLAPEEKAALGNMLLGRAVNPQTKKELPIGSLGLDCTLKGTISGQKGTFSFSLDANVDAKKTMMKGLEAKFPEQDPRTAPEIPPRKDREQLEIRFLGTARQEFPDGSFAVATVLDEWGQAARQAESELARDYLKKLGLEGKSIGPSVDPKALPKEVSDRLSDAFAGAWRLNGFGSREEAASYFGQVREVSLSTEFGLFGLIRPRNSVTGAPGSGYSVTFMRSPTVILP